MDALKAQLLKIQQQLAGLNASQKMLTASLVAIMIMTILWWARYAGTAELEPVLTQSLTAEQVGEVQMALTGHGIESHVVGDRVMVASDRKMEALALLTYDDKLPSNSSNVWDDMLKQMSPWDPKSKTDSTLNHGRELMLGQVIKAYFPGVSKASVQINPLSDRRVGASLDPTAGVTILTSGRDVDQKRLGEGVAALVASSTAGMARKNVSVMINGRVQRVTDSADDLSGEALEQKVQWEQRYTQKVERLMPADSVVAVEVKIDTTSSQEHRQEFDPTKSLQKEKSIKSNTEETQQQTAQAPDPGAVSNSSLTLGGQTASGGGNSTSVDKSETEMENFVAKSEKTINAPAGVATVQSVAVNVPRRYFVGLAKKNLPAGKEPDEKAVQAQFDQEMPKLRDVAATTVAMASTDHVIVSMFDDSAMPMMAGIGPAEATAGGAGMSGMVTSHAREIVLGALAVISLFMVSTIVKKGTPPSPVVAPAVAKETPRLATDEAVAGIVGGDGNSTLDGMELGEDAVKAQQMVEQVSTMVKENPEAAANLVKRWLNRS